MLPVQLVYDGQHSEVVTQTTIGLPLWYMCAAAYYSLFKLGMFSFYHMVPRATEPHSLLMNSAQVCSCYKGGPGMQPHNTPAWVCRLHGPACCCWAFGASCLLALSCRRHAAMARHSLQSTPARQGASGSNVTAPSWRL